MLTAKREGTGDYCRGEGHVVIENGVRESYARACCERYVNRIYNP
jgi:hypothetical protein